MEDEDIEESFAKKEFIKSFAETAWERNSHVSPSHSLLFVGVSLRLDFKEEVWMKTGDSTVFHQTDLSFSFGKGESKGESKINENSKQIKKTPIQPKTKAQKRNKKSGRQVNELVKLSKLALYVHGAGQDVSVPQLDEADKIKASSSIPPNPFRNFLALVQNGQLTYYRNSDVPTQYHLDDSDPTFQWLGNCGLNVTNFVSVGDIEDPRNIQMTIQLSKSSVELQFSSSAVANMFGKETLSANYLHGVLPGGIGIVLGLEKVGNQDLTLLQLVQRLELDHRFGIQMFESMAALGHWSLKFDTDGAKKDSHPRCGVWYLPYRDHRTILRLEMVATPSSASSSFLESILGDLWNSIKSIRFIVRLESKILSSSNTTVVGLSRGEVILSITAPDIHSEFAIQFSDGAITVTMLSQDKSDSVVDWIFSHLPDDCRKDFDNFRSNIRNWKFQPTIHILQVQAKFSLNGSVTSLESFKIDLLLVLTPNKHEKEVPIKLSYAYPQNRFVGAFGQSRLDRRSEFPSPSLDPDYETFRESEIGDSNFAKTLNIASFFSDDPSSVSLPVALNPVVTSTKIAIDRNSIQLYAELECLPGVRSQGTRFLFDSAEFNASWIFKHPSQTTLSIVVAFYLAPKHNKPPIIGEDTAVNNSELDWDLCVNGPPGAVKVHGRLAYDSGAWKLEATLCDCRFDVLAGFFDHDEQISVMNILKHIDIHKLDLHYNYDKSGGDTHFAMDGTIGVGDALFTFGFGPRPRGEKGWAIYGEFMPNNKVVTVGSLIQYFSGKDSSVSLPAYIGELLIVPQADTKIEFHCEGGGGPREYTVVQLKIQIGSFALSFIQLRQHGFQHDVKRILQVTTNTPHFTALPIIGELKLPISSLEYVRVWDKTAPGEVVGLTMPEIKMLAPIITLRLPKNASSDYVLSPHSHFRLIDGNEVLLDYIAGSHGPSANRGDQQERSNQSNSSDDTNKHDEPVNKDSKDPPPSHTVPLKKKANKLSFSHIGLSYKDEVLSLIVDATIELGPFTCQLVGCSIGLDLKKIKFNDLFSAKPLFSTDLIFSLSSLAVAWTRPPIEMAGSLSTVTSGKSILYQGGFSISFPSFGLTAVGEYGSINTPSKFDTLFVWASVNGPLLEMEFGKVTDVRVGVGYHSALRLPTLQDVTQFPLIQPVEGDTALKILEKLSEKNAPSGGKWVSPKNDSYWFAAGCSITLVELLDITAVIIFEFNPKLVLNISALATTQLPRAASSKLPTFLSLQLGVTSTLDFQHGSLTAGGALSPNCYLFDPNCHITGAFGFGYWFGGSGHKGDWVLTLGGYHPAFIPPSHYPTPDRVALNWNIGDILSCHGEAYFAATPHCLMAGARLFAAYAAGPVSAHFEANFDFLMAYWPLKYQGRVAVVVGVGYEVDEGILGCQLAVDVGAEFDVQGPPFYGTMIVNISCFSFELQFGEPPNFIPLTLAQFSDSLLDEGPNQKKKESIIFSLIKGGFLGTKKDPTESTWRLRGGDAAIRIVTVFPNSSIDNILPSETELFYSRPMQLTTPLTSSLEITMTKTDDEDRGVVQGLTLTPVLQKRPRKTWGKCKSQVVYNSR
jgi:hypothetical protein